MLTLQALKTSWYFWSGNLSLLFPFSISSPYTNILHFVLKGELFFTLWKVEIVLQYHKQENMQKVTYILKCQITDVSWHCSQPVSTLLGCIKLKYPSTNSIECQHFKCIRSAVRRNISVKEDLSVLWNCPILISVQVIFMPFDKFWVFNLPINRKATKPRIIGQYQEQQIQQVLSLYQYIHVLMIICFPWLYILCSSLLNLR